MIVYRAWPISTFQACCPTNIPSPDATSLIAACCKDATLAVIHVRTLQHILMPTHGHVVSVLRFDHSGLVLASAGPDACIRLWAVGTAWPLDMTPLRDMEISLGSVTDMGFSCRDRFLATASRGDHSARVWDVTTGQLVHALDGHPEGVVRIACSPVDEDFLATGGGDLVVRLWRGSALVQSFTGHTHALTSLTFTLDGLIVISSSKDRTVRAWLTEATSPHSPIISAHVACTGIPFAVVVSNDSTCHVGCGDGALVTLRHGKSAGAIQLIDVARQQVDRAVWALTSPQQACSSSGM